MINYRILMSVCWKFWVRDWATKSKACPSSNRVSTFPLGKKVVVAVTEKLAIGQGPKEGEIRRLLSGVLEQPPQSPRHRKEGKDSGEPLLDDINSHNVLRGGIWPVSSPSDALEHGLGVITPNHPKTCSREQFSFRTWENLRTSSPPPPRNSYPFEFRQRHTITPRKFIYSPSAF